MPWKLPIPDKMRHIDPIKAMIGHMTAGKKKRKKANCEALGTPLQLAQSWELMGPFPFGEVTGAHLEPRRFISPPRSNLLYHSEALSAGQRAERLSYSYLDYSHLFPLWGVPS